MTTAYEAPALATPAQAAKELYGTEGQRYKIYRDARARLIPALREGERGLRIPMPAARRFLNGEEINRALFLDVEDA